MKKTVCEDNRKAEQLRRCHRRFLANLESVEGIKRDFCQHSGKRRINGKSIDVLKAVDKKYGIKVQRGGLRWIER